MLSLLLAISLQATAPQASATEVVPQVVADVAQMVQAEATPQAPAISFAIRDGDQIYAFAWGSRGIDEAGDSVPATTQTRFRTASIAKPMTAIAAAILWQRGKVELDKDIRAWVPEFGEKPWPVTLRQLGAHLGGVRHYDGHPTPAVSTNDVVAEVADYGDDPLFAEPGTKFHYTTFGFNLMGAIIQKASEQEYRAFMQTEVFGPLGMENTIAEVHRTELGEVAALYQPIPGGLGRVKVPRNDIGYKWPGGGFITTATDLVKMTTAVCTGDLLSEDARALMRTRATTTEGKQVGYSFGWSVSGGGEQPLMLSHGGSQLGARSFLVVFPDHDLAVAILANQSGAAIGDGKLARKAARMLLEERTAGAEE